MQKLKYLSDPIIIEGHKFIVRRSNSIGCSVYLVSSVSDTTYLIDYFSCNSNNIYYIRRRARYFIKKFLNEYREKYK